jgi:hypothetical protein
MTHFPLLFGFRDLVAGRGFLAGVAVSGRALLLDEDEGLWMYGVNPGGMAAGGANVGEVQRSFRETYRTILFDIAADAPSFDTFRQEVQAFFWETNEGILAEWNEAVQEVRAGTIDANWLARVDSDAAKLLVEVVSLSPELLEPGLNTPVEQEPFKAAA